MLEIQNFLHKYIGFYCVYNAILHGLLHGAVTATGVDEIALGGGGAYATATAAEAGTAALRLALVVFEDEEVVGAEFHFGTQQGLIGGLFAPFGHTALGHLLQIVINTNSLITGASIRGIGGPVHEGFARGHMSGVIHIATQHENIGQQEQTEHYKDKCNPRGHFYLTGRFLGVGSKGCAKLPTPIHRFREYAESPHP